MSIERPRLLLSLIGAALVALTGLGVAGCAPQVPSPSIGAHADPELEARFPATLHGQDVLLSSFDDPDTLRLVGVTDDFLGAVDVPISMVTVALVDHEWTTDVESHMSATAIRARGARPRDLVEYFVPIIEGQSEGITFSRVRFGDKHVWRPKGNPIAVAGNTLYVKGDTAYLIYADSKGATNLLLAQLP
jgi:hypothetical protein